MLSPRHLVLVFLLSCQFFYSGYGAKFSQDDMAKDYVVKIEQGRVRGWQKTSIYFQGYVYYSFSGIPYAKPPVGPLRFKDPEEPESWSGILDAFREDDPKQETDAERFDRLVKHRNYTDDILYLTVDTPLVGKIGKPVIVRIHPMTYVVESQFTSEFYTAAHYMVEDVVLVSINYRSNVLGFLCFDHEDVSCNAGLKDQVMALKWVQKNIANFSGNPDNVTLLGITLGGAFIHYHLMSPLSRGLFHGAIIQSGSALSASPYIPRQVAVKRGYKLAKLLRFETQNGDILLQFLRNTSAKNLFEAAEKLLDTGESLIKYRSAFQPCIEVPATNKSFLTQTPRSLLKEGKFANVSILFGITNVEAVTWLSIFHENDEFYKNETEQFLKYIPENMGFQNNSEEVRNVSDKIRSFYFGDRPLSQKTIANHSTLLYDLTFTIGFDESVRLHLEHAKLPFYVFELKIGDRSIDLLPSFGGESAKAKAETLYKVITKLWTSFARTGNPNKNGLNMDWEPARKDNMSYLCIDKIIRPVRGRIAENRMLMWQELYEKYPHTY